MIPGRNPLIVAGLCCILLPSLGMLAATFYNRSAVPSSVLQLTERELRLPGDDADTSTNSALTFGLTWRVAGMSHTDIGTPQPTAVPVPWMTAGKAADLGIKTQADLRLRPAVPAFLVLEFNGPTYARELQRACRDAQGTACAHSRDVESRLYVVDAGSDPRLLRREYPDPSVYAITPGVVTFSSAPGEGAPAATIGGPDVETVQAQEPIRSDRSRTSGEMAWHALSQGKAFVADIAFGRRHEPWDQAVTFGPHSTVAPPDVPVSREGGQVEIN